MFENLALTWPLTLLAIPLPLLLLLKIRNRHERNKQTAIAIPLRLTTAFTQITQEQSAVPDNLRKLLPWFCWVLLLLAIAQPSLQTQSIIQPATGRAIALSVDLSASMERDDFELNNEVSTRLAVVKKVAGEFIERRQGDRMALILFGDEAFIASPLTFDVLAIKSHLNSAGIGMAGKSTAIGDALGLSIQALRNDPAKEKAIILLSDGTNNAGSVEPESAAELANSLSITIHTIALGSDQEGSGFKTAPAADLDEKTLKAIASAANGTFFRAKTSDDLTAIYEKIETLSLAQTDSPPIVLKKDIRNYLLAVLLLLLLIWAWLEKAHRL